MRFSILFGFSLLVKAVDRTVFDEHIVPIALYLVVGFLIDIWEVLKNSRK